MTVGAILADAAKAASVFETMLAAEGFTAVTFGNAIAKTIGDIKTIQAGDYETVGLDILETALPQLRLGVELFRLFEKLPGKASADWNSPVRLATDDSPYADSERDAAAKLEGNT